MKEDFEQWIIDELNGELEERESAELKGWLAADETHRAMYDELARVHRRIKELRTPLRVDVTQRLAEVKGQRHKERFVGRRVVVAMWVAAAMVVLALGSVWLIGKSDFRDSGVEMAKGQMIMPAEGEAYFVLGNGECVNLGRELRDTMLREAEGLEVWVDAEQVLHMQAGSGEKV
ncbi:MAG: hypothetical protein K2M86_02040, partial [Odoribacter sp.]|nr:hypothetical protein [Odoribacter sp.]